MKRRKTSLRAYMIESALRFIESESEVDYPDIYCIKHNEDDKVFQRNREENAFGIQSFIKYINSLPNCESDYQSNLEQNDFLRVSIGEISTYDILGCLCISTKLDKTPRFATEFLRRNIEINPNEPIYFKIRANNSGNIELADQFISYIINQQQYDQQIQVIKEIERENSQLLKGRRRVPVWGEDIFECHSTEKDNEDEFLRNIFLVQEPLLQAQVSPNGEFELMISSYGQMIQLFLKQAKMIME